MSSKTAFVLQVLHFACIFFSVGAIYDDAYRGGANGAPDSVRCSLFQYSGYGATLNNNIMHLKGYRRPEVTSYDAEGNVLFIIKRAQSTFQLGDCRIKYIKIVDRSKFCNSYEVDLTVGIPSFVGIIAHTDGNSTYISIGQTTRTYGFDLVHYKNNSRVENDVVIQLEGCNLHGSEFAYESRGCAIAKQSDRSVISRRNIKLTSAAQNITILFGLQNHTYYANYWSPSSGIEYYLRQWDNEFVMKNGSITTSGCTYGENLFAKLKCNINGTTALDEYRIDYPASKKSIKFDSDVSAIVSNSTGSDITLSVLHYDPNGIYKYYLNDNNGKRHIMENGSITISGCPTNYTTICVRVKCCRSRWFTFRIALVQDILPKYFMPINQSNVHINSNGSHVTITLNGNVDNDVCARVYNIQLGYPNYDWSYAPFEQAIGERKTYIFEGAGRVKISLKYKTAEGEKAPELEMLFGTPVVQMNMLD